MALALAFLMLVPSQEEATLPRALAQSEPARSQEQDRYPPVEAARPAESGRPFVDLEWLELTPAAGLVVYSSKFLADAEPGLALRARAPMPWLSPSDDPIGEYFGAFVGAAFAPIERRLSPSVPRRRGVTSYYSLGLDYSFLRDETWILIGRAGATYAHYGGVADLRSGFGPLVGLSAGVQISGRFGLTYSPEIVFGDTGSRVFLHTLGLLIQF